MLCGKMAVDVHVMCKNQNRFFSGKTYTIPYTTDIKEKVIRIYIDLDSSYRGRSCIFSAILGGGSANFLAIMRGWVMFF